MAKAKRRKRGRVSVAARQGAQNQQKKFMKYGLGGAGVAAIVMLVVFAVASSSGSSGVGASAPDFEFSMYQGIDEVGFREGDLSSLHGGRPMVLNFWAGLCLPCRAEDASVPGVLRGVQRRYYAVGHRHRTVYGPWLKRRCRCVVAGIGGDLIRLGGPTMAACLANSGVTSMPTTVFIRSNGEIFQEGQRRHRRQLPGPGHPGIDGRGGGGRGLNQPSIHWCWNFSPAKVLAAAL